MEQAVPPRSLCTAALPGGKLNEDLFLIPKICLQIQKAVVVPKALYYYVQRGGSIMSGNKTLRHFDAAEAAQRTGNVLWKTLHTMHWQMRQNLRWAA